VAMSSARHHRRRRAAGVSRRSKGCLTEQRPRFPPS
jgi:hypothetical protein